MSETTDAEQTNVQEKNRIVLRMKLRPSYATPTVHSSHICASHFLADILKMEAQEQEPALHKYSVGDEVEVFYRMRRLRGSCLASSSLSAGLLAPRVGISDGWQPAIITSLPDSYGEYEVQYTHVYWFERGGRRRSVNSTDKFDHEHVPTWQIREKSSNLLTYPPPKLSLFIIRWGGFNGEEANAFDGTAAGLWGHAGTSVCDKYINAMCDNFESSLGTDFEVTTAFVQYGNDLEALAAAAPFIRASLRGDHVAGLYFLWPVAFQDKAGGAAGMVPEGSYFQAVQRLEMTGRMGDEEVMLRLQELWWSGVVLCCSVLSNSSFCVTDEM